LGLTWDLGACQQTNVENVVETFKGDVDKVEMDLERTILIFEDQENVVVAPIF
jgi:hypothetical protein